MTEPRWLTEAEVCAIHDRQLAEHGGSAGLLDPGLLKSALDRPKNLYAYEAGTILQLAASYAFGITKNHPFNDGNKRTRFLAAYVFFGLNGYKLRAPQEEVVLVVTDLASGQINQDGFVRWLEKRAIANRQTQSGPGSF